MDHFPVNVLSKILKTLMRAMNRGKNLLNQMLTKKKLKVIGKLNGTRLAKCGQVLSNWPQVKPALPKSYLK
jgi:hypothetical protein